MRIAWSLLSPLLVATTACAPVSREDAEAAVDQAALATQTQLLAATIIELGTGFAPGLSPEDAAQALADSIVAETGCATAVATAEQVDIDFGTADAPCTYRGRTLSGCAELRIITNSAEQVEVSHFWVDGSTDVCHGDDLSDAVMVLDGTATVTWVPGQPTRTVVLHEAIWRTLDGDSLSTATGTLEQLAGDDATSLSLAGTQQWVTAGEDWALTSEGIEAGWLAAVPSAGTHAVINPSGTLLTITYAAAGEDAVELTVEGGGKRFSFTIRE